MELITNTSYDNSLLRRLQHDTSAERPLAAVDIIWSYIQTSGVNALDSVFRTLCDNSVPVRVLTTTAMGISQPEAIRKLAQYDNVQVKVLWACDIPDISFHAKGWRFREYEAMSDGIAYGAAIIGSSNMSYSALVTGVEMNVRVLDMEAADGVLRTFDETFELYWNGGRSGLRPRLYDDETFDLLKADSEAARGRPGRCECADCTRHKEEARKKTRKRGLHALSEMGTIEIPMHERQSRTEEMELEDVNDIGGGGEAGTTIFQRAVVHPRGVAENEPGLQDMLRVALSNRWYSYATALKLGDYGSMQFLEVCGVLAREDKHFYGAVVEGALLAYWTQYRVHRGSRLQQWARKLREQDQLQVAVLRTAQQFANMTAFMWKGYSSEMEEERK